MVEDFLDEIKKIVHSDDIVNAGQFVTLRVKHEFKTQIFNLADKMSASVVDCTLLQNNTWSFTFKTTSAIVAGLSTLPAIVEPQHPAFIEKPQKGQKQPKSLDISSITAAKVK